MGGDRSLAERPGPWRPHLLRNRFAAERGAAVAALMPTLLTAAAGVPPLWQTWPVQVGAAVALAAAILLAHRLRIASLRRRHAELERLVAERTEALARKTEELEAKNQELYVASVRDPLTGLYNRGFGVDALERALAHARRTGRPLACLSFDIDHFKRVNDGFGHAVGDQVLRRVAGALVSTARAEDVVVRWGGEEFLVLLPDTELDGAVAFAERARARIETERPFEGGPGVTASAGAALARWDDGIDLLLRRADVALYRAKSAGRNRVEADSD